MSASLVGSEMCIRDRHRRAPSFGEPQRAAESPESPGEPRRAPQSPGTVSYTHLTLPTICSV
eukprot:8647259-Alexandrium_andersonii.AAC.1